MNRYVLYISFLGWIFSTIPLLASDQENTLPREFYTIKIGKGSQKISSAYLKNYELLYNLASDEKDQEGEIDITRFLKRGNLEFLTIQDFKNLHSLIVAQKEKEDIRAFVQQYSYSTLLKMLILLTLGLISSNKEIEIRIRETLNKYTENHPQGINYEELKKHKIFIHNNVFKTLYPYPCLSGADVYLPKNVNDSYTNLYVNKDATLCLAKNYPSLNFLAIKDAKAQIIRKKDLYSPFNKVFFQDKTILMGGFRNIIIIPDIETDYEKYLYGWDLNDVITIENKPFMILKNKNEIIKTSLTEYIHSGSCSQTGEITGVAKEVIVTLPDLVKQIDYYYDPTKQIHLVAINTTNNEAFIKLISNNGKEIEKIDYKDYTLKKAFISPSGFLVACIQHRANTEDLGIEIYSIDSANNLKKEAFIALLTNQRLARFNGVEQWMAIIGLENLYFKDILTGKNKKTIPIENYNNQSFIFWDDTKDYCVLNEKNKPKGRYSESRLRFFDCTTLEECYATPIAIGLVPVTGFTQRNGYIFLTELAPKAYYPFLIGIKPLEAILSEIYKKQKKTENSNSLSQQARINEQIEKLKFFETHKKAIFSRTPIQKTYLIEKIKKFIPSLETVAKGITLANVVFWSIVGAQFLKEKYDNYKTTQYNNKFEKNFEPHAAIHDALLDQQFKILRYPSIFKRLKQRLGQGKYTHRKGLGE